MDLKEKEKLAERSLKWLHGEAEAVGKQAAEVAYLEEFCKIELSRLAKLFVGMSNAAAKDEALTHPHYLEALKVLQKAREVHEMNRMKRAAAEGYIAFYQTGSANSRANV